MPPKRKGRSREYIDDSDDPEDTGAKTKKAKQAATGGDTEDEMIQLSAKRFVNVRTFNGKILVDIREFYQDDSGEQKPGRKGIALSLDQWEKLKDVIPEIDAKIHGQS